MTPVSWALDEAIVTVPGVYVERGTRYPDFESPERVVVLRGLFEPGPGDEDPAAYAVSVTGTFRARGRHDVPASARVEVPGVGSFGLASDGQVLRSPTGALTHTVLVLTSWEVR